MTYPFTYWKDGEHYGFLKLGFRIREPYIKWIATNNFKYVEAAIEDISLLVGWQWQKLFGGKEMDPDVMDPVTYKIIFKFIGQTLPISAAMGRFLKTIARRMLIRQAYRKPLVPDSGDKSVRAFNYRPFSVPADVENKMFLDDMKELVLDYVEHDTRLEPDKRRACRYIAELMLKERLPSPLVLRDKYSIPYDKQEFYLSFTRVIVRSELYKLRDALPHLYGNEDKHFVVVFDEQSSDEIKETEEEEETSSDTAVWDF